MSPNRLNAKKSGIRIYRTAVFLDPSVCFFITTVLNELRSNPVAFELNARKQAYSNEIISESALVNEVGGFSRIYSSKLKW